MAALSLQAGVQITRLQGVVPATGFLIQRLSYSDSSSEKIRPIKKPSLASLKRGTGGRSSFSGIVATVFGATGILGNHVCHRLGKIGSQVIVPYRGDHYELLRLRLAGELGQVLFLPFNLRDEDSIYKAVKYSNVVINLVGRDWETKNFTFHDVHVEGAARLARIAKEAGVEKFIHVSDLNAAEKPEGHVIKGGSRYLASKWEGEQAVCEEFPGAVIMRPSFIVGPNDKFVRMYTSIMRHSLGFLLPMYKKGEHTIKQPVFVYDVAEGIVRAVKDKDSDGKIYQAVGPKRYKLGDLADWFHEEIRVDISDKWAYRRIDMKYDPFFKLQVMMNEKLTLSWPIGGVHLDMIERESVTDVVRRKLPTLEDLGVNLTPMEDCIPWILRPYIVDSYYDAELNEFAKPVPPQPVV